MSPELLDPERFEITECRPTKQSDCYALGMVIYEVRIDLGVTPLRLFDLFAVRSFVETFPFGVSPT